MWNLKKSKKKSPEIQRLDWWLPDVGGKMGEGSEKVQTFSYKINKSWNDMYIMATVISNTVLYIRKFLRKDILKVFNIKNNPIATFGDEC